MQAFHNGPKVKQFYVDRLTEHHRLDQIVQGTGWDGNNGCNVGCILHKYSHDAYPTELGLPVWYAHLCDKIFEGLPRDKAPAFAMATLTAIPVGASIENVRWKLAILRHERDIARLEGNSEPYAVQGVAAIQGVIDYCRMQLSGTATGSAYSAYSARSAAESAAYSAADSAAYSAYSAYSAADSARSAYSAARSAAESAAYSAWVTEAETLVKLLLECAE